MNQDQLYNRIDQYLKGELSGEDIIQFELELKEDNLLATKVEQWKLANDLILEHHIFSATKELKKIHASSLQRKLFLRALLLILALGVLVMAIFYFGKNTVSKKKVNTIEHEQTDVLQVNHPENITIKKDKRSQYKVQNIAPEPTTTEEASTFIAAHEEEEIRMEPKPDGIAEMLPGTIPTQERETENICKDSDFRISFSTSPSCAEKNSGSIRIQSVQGGKEPYRFNVRDVLGNRSDVSELLAAGNYTLELSDDRNCKHTELFSIGRTACSVDHAFNPFLGEVWNIPESQHNGHLSIVDANGRAIFEKHLHAGVINSWDGNTELGALKAGYYFYSIRYENQSIVTGTLTLLQ